MLCGVMGGARSDGAGKVRSDQSCLASSSALFLRSRAVSPYKAWLCASARRSATTATATSTFSGKIAVIFWGIIKVGHKIGR
jgi:hypothetical protein